MARVAPDTWTPAVWSPAAVTDMQTRLDPVRMTRRADDWQQAVDRISDILADLDAQVAAQLERSWRGQGADASADALRRYVADSLSGLSACRSAAVHLNELSTAAGELRAVVTHDLDNALVAVRQCYSAPAVVAGNAVEDIPAPPDPFQLAHHPSLTTLPSGVTPSANPMRTGQSPSSPTAFPPQSAPRGWSGADPSSPTITPEPQWPAATHSAAAPSSPVDAPVPPRPDPPVTITGQPASGPPPNSSSGPPQSMVARAAAPSAGMPFMGGMYPGHMAREGGGDHRAPRYLVSAGNSNELIGELPLVAPPVIGE